MNKEMNEEVKKLMWELHDYALSTLRHYDRGDSHWETTLSLARYTAKELLELTKNDYEEE